MGRKVYVSGDMATDPRVLDVADDDPQAALLWPWIIMALDDWGRAEADPRALKFSLFPGIETVTKATIGDALEAYARHHLIVLYEAEGRRWMAVPPARWWRWQTHIHKDKRQDDSGSHCPRPPDPVVSEVDGVHSPERGWLASESGDMTGVADNTGPPAESRDGPRDPAESRASLHLTTPHLTTPHREHVPSAESARDEREPAAKPYEPDFEPLWQAYPRRMYRAKALKAFQALMRRTPPADQSALLVELVAATGHYADAKATAEARHVMHGATWFGPDEPWRDWTDGNPEPAGTNGNGHRPDPFDQLAARLKHEVTP